MEERKEEGNEGGEGRGKGRVESHTILGLISVSVSLFIHFLYFVRFQLA